MLELYSKYVVRKQEIYPRLEKRRKDVKEENPSG